MPARGRHYTIRPLSPAVSDLLTVDECCHMLRVKRTTLYHLLSSKQLASLTMGSRRFCRRADVQALAERGIGKIPAYRRGVLSADEG